MERSSKKSSRLEGEEKLKAKRCIEKNNIDGARLHAEAAIRNHNEGLNSLQLANRVSAMASQLSAAMSMKKVALPRLTLGMYDVLITR